MQYACSSAWQNNSDCHPACMRQRGLPRSRDRGTPSRLQYRWPPTRGPSQTYERQRRPQRLECTCPKKRPAFRLSLGSTCWLRHVLYASDPLRWYVEGAGSQMHVARSIRYVACQCIVYAAAKGAHADGARACDRPAELGKGEPTAHHATQR